MKLIWQGTTTTFQNYPQWTRMMRAPITKNTNNNRFTFIIMKNNVRDYFIIKHAKKTVPKIVKQIFGTRHWKVLATFEFRQPRTQPMKKSNILKRSVQGNWQPKVLAETGFRHSRVHINTKYHQSWKRIKFLPRRTKAKTELRARWKTMNGLPQLTTMTKAKLLQVKHKSISEELPTNGTKRLCF